MADHFSPVMSLFGGLYRLGRLAGMASSAHRRVAFGARCSRCGARSELGQPDFRGGLLVGLSSAAAGRRPLRLPSEHPGRPFHRCGALFALAEPAGSRRGSSPSRSALLPCRPGARPLWPSCWWRIGWCGRSGGVAWSRRGRHTVLPTQFGETTGWDTHFGHLGHRRSAALLHPWDVARHLLSGKACRALSPVGAACGVAILRRPRWPLAVVLAGLPVLLSRWKGTGLPWYRYAAAMAPLAIGGRLAGLPSRRPATGVGRVWLADGVVARARARARAREPPVAGGSQSNRVGPSRQRTRRATSTRPLALGPSPGIGERLPAGAASAEHTARSCTSTRSFTRGAPTSRRQDPARPRKYGGRRRRCGHRADGLRGRFASQEGFEVVDEVGGLPGAAPGRPETTAP